MTLQASPWNNPADVQTRKAALGFGDVTLRGADWRLTQDELQNKIEGGVSCAAVRCK